MLSAVLVKLPGKLDLLDMEQRWLSLTRIYVEDDD
jgi:hypothetical protein